LESPLATRLSLLALLTTILILVALVFSVGMPINDDAAVYLLCAQRLLDGNVPYVDYVELNPPLAHYVHIPPVYLARQTGIEPTLIFHILVLVLTLWSAFCFWRIISKSRVASTPAGTYLMTSCWVLFSVIVFGEENFGQREHLFILAFVPFLFVREARYRDVGLNFLFALAVGLGAGLFLFLKPYFLFLWVSLELWLTYRTRRFSALYAIESLVPLTLGVLYTGHFWLVPPEMRIAYFQRWLPFIFEHYNVYNADWPRLLLLDSVKQLTILFTTVACSIVAFSTWKRARQSTRVQIEVVWLSMTLSFATYFWQSKGWLYHLLPMLGFLVVLLSILIVLTLEIHGAQHSTHRNLSFKSRLVSVVSAIMIGSFLLIYRVSANAITFTSTLQPYIEYIVNRTEGDDRVTFISTNVFPACATLVEARRLSGTRFLAMFPIAMFQQHAAPDTADTFSYKKLDDMGIDEKQFLRELGADVIGNKPKLIFIQTSQCQACPRSFRIDQYLQRCGWVHDNLVDYRMSGTVLDFIVFQRVSS